MANQNTSGGGKARSFFSIPFLITVSGFLLGILMVLIGNSIDQSLKNVLTITGVVLIFLGVFLSRLRSPVSGFGEGNERELGAPFYDHYSDYKRIGQHKKKSAPITYSEWKKSLLEEYNPYGTPAPDPDKKVLTEDFRHFLKEQKRDMEERVELFKSLTIPAEFGIVASVYELDMPPFDGEVGFAIVIALTMILGFFFVIELNFGNKVVRYTEDLAEVLGITERAGE